MSYLLLDSPGRYDNPVPAASPEVCLEIPKILESPSEWAKSTLKFPAEPKQVEILDHPAHRLILCCPRQWGKSTVVAIKALYLAINNPNTEILIIADTEPRGGIIVEKIITYAATLGIPKRRVRGKDFSFQLPNGSKIFAVAHNMRSGLGYTINIVIVDEAALVDDEVLGYVTRTMARTNGHLWLLSTPRGQTGLFYAIWHDDGFDWHRVKTDIDESNYVDPQFVQEQKKLFPATFRQDFYCEFLQSPGRLFSREMLDRCIDPALTSRVMRDEDPEEGEEL